MHGTCGLVLPSMVGRLSIVATPIGNLADITLRALRTITECDVMFAEDTRVTSKILARHGIVGKPLHRLDAHARDASFARVAALLREGKHVAYATDAGTPAVSDPGTALVAYTARMCPDAAIEPIPGPSALTALVSICDVPVHEFSFLGFLPVRKGRAATLQRIAASNHATIFYESPYRVLKTLHDLTPLLGDRRIVVGRELTKLHESVYCGTATEVIAQLERGSTRGEFVVAVGGATT